MKQHLFVSTRQQRLFLFQQGFCVHDYSISSAKKGLGEQEGSHCTPRGWHEITEVIGLNEPINSVFKARKLTGQIYSAELEQEYPNKDWVLSRIIRLKGQEKGFNLEGAVDSYQRYIYIHGCAAEHLLGQPASHGCIRMSNQELIELARLIKIGDTVFIA